MIDYSKLLYEIPAIALWLTFVGTYFSAKWSVYASMFTAPPELDLFPMIRHHDEMFHCDICPPRPRHYNPAGQIPGWGWNSGEAGIQLNPGRQQQNYAVYPGSFLKDLAGQGAFDAFPRKKTYGQLKEEMRLDAEAKDCEHKTTDGRSAFAETNAGEICQICMTRRVTGSGSDTPEKAMEFVHRFFQYE